MGSPHSNVFQPRGVVRIVLMAVMQRTNSKNTGECLEVSACIHKCQHRLMKCCEYILMMKNILKLHKLHKLRKEVSYSQSSTTRQYLERWCLMTFFGHMQI